MVFSILSPFIVNKFYTRHSNFPPLFSDAIISYMDCEKG